MPTIGAFKPDSALPGTVDAAVPNAVTASGPAVPDPAVAGRPAGALPWTDVAGRADAAETAAPAAIDPGNEMQAQAATSAPRSRVRGAVDGIPGRTR
jgi:hypothetical protein